jgi:TolB-like protein/DNA-binding winged helix-turn-helix (wHTH) protein/Tfp pilus assembly protein PilF
MRQQTKGFYRFGPFRLDLSRRRLLENNRPLPLPSKGFEILLVLVESAGRVVEKDELLKKVWPDTFVEENNLTVNISALRKALGVSPNEHRYIMTIPGRGYRFVAEVEETEDEPSEVIVEKHTISHLSIEEEELGADSRLPNPALRALSPAEPVAALSKPQEARTAWRPAARSPRLALLLGVAALAIGLAAAIYWFSRGVKGRETPQSIRSIAVLPLENLSGDPTQEYFADGMTDELITNLAQIGALKVISRTSVMRYKGTKTPLPEIARQLNVEAVLEGAVVRSGTRVRVTAQLIRADTDQHLWAEAYERDLKDVLALQDDVARDIAREVKVKLTPQERVLLSTAHPVNPEAHEAYLKGRYYWGQMSANRTEKALKYFERAVEIDPNYAEGYAGLADWYSAAGTWGVLPPREAFPKAKEAAKKALALNGLLAEAHASLAMVLFFYDWNWPAAEKEIRRSLELNPGNPLSRDLHGEYLTAMGRHGEALEQARMAQSLDPLSEPAGLGVGYLYYHEHDYDGALMQFRKTLEMYPDSPEAHNALADAYRQKGLYQQAVTEYQRGDQLSGRSAEEVAASRRAFEKSGIRGYWQEQVRSGKADRKRGYVDPYAVAVSYACLEDKDQTLEWLEKGYEERSSSLVLVKRDPQLDFLRSDPRFDALLKRIGLPP